MEQMNSIRGNTRFLNVDLELVATLDVGPLLAHWAGDIVVLRDSIEGGRRTIWAELPDCPQDADSGMVSSRVAWRHCPDASVSCGVRRQMLQRWNSGWSRPARDCVPDLCKDDRRA